MGTPKRMNFRKSSKLHLTPPSFSENQIADFATKVRMFIMAGLLCIIWSYFPWDACSTTVQCGNWLKTYPKKSLLCHFHAEKALFNVQNLQHKLLDWKWPPPLWNFSENSSVLVCAPVPKRHVLTPCCSPVMLLIWELCPPHLQTDWPAALLTIDETYLTSF